MNIVHMSLAASFLIIFIVTLRIIPFDKISKNTIMLMWKITMVRLLVPFSIPNNILMLGGISSTADYIRVAPKDLVSNTQPLNLNALYSRIDISNQFLETTNTINPFLVIWIVGTGIALLAFLKAYIKGFSIFREAIPIEDNVLINAWIKEQRFTRKIKVMISDKITTPVTFGVLNPKIVLPTNIKFQNNKQLQYVITHELIHVKRFDSLWKIGSILCLCIHWFNPLVWLMYACINRDMEMACDENVINIYGEADKPEYAETLLHLAEQNSTFYPLYNGFGKKAISERVHGIMKYKKKTIISISLSILSVALIILLVILISGDRKPASKNEEAIKTVVENIYTSPNDELLKLQAELENKLLTNPPSQVDILDYYKDINDKIGEIYKEHISSDWYDSFLMRFANSYYIYAIASDFNITVDHIDITQSDTMPTNYSFIVYLDYSKVGEEKARLEIEGSAQFTEEEGKISYLQLFDRDFRLELMKIGL